MKGKRWWIVSGAALTLLAAGLLLQSFYGQAGLPAAAKGLALGPTGPQAQLAAAPGAAENPLLKEDWFWAQRAFPAGQIPLAVQDAAIHAELGSQPSEEIFWTNLGPAPLKNITFNGQSEQNASGRAQAVAVKPGDANTILLGTAGGGIWKSTNGGISFSPVSENMPSLAINVIRYAPSNPTIVYAGTGEAYGSLSINAQGLLKSTDGGSSWRVLPPNGSGWDFRYASITGLQVHPSDPNTLYLTTAAVLAPASAFKPAQAPQTGIFKSTDGGQTWTLLKASSLHLTPTLPAQGSLGFMDLELARSNPNLLYASEYAGGIWKSSNAGSTWDLITPLKPGGGAELPAAVPNYAYFLTFQARFLQEQRFPLPPLYSEFWRIEIGLSQSNPDVLYAGVSAHLRLDTSADGTYDPASDTDTPGGLLFKTTDGGAHWTWLGDWVRNGVPDYCADQCDYANAVEVNPFNADDVLIGGSANYTAHWPDPLETPTRYLEQPWRGMVYRSLDGGSSWVDTTPQCITVSTVPSDLFNNLPVYPCSPNVPAMVIHPNVHSLSYNPSGGGRIYAANDGGLNRATFSGTGASSSDYTWANLNQGLAAGEFYSIDVHPTDPGQFVGGLRDNSVAHWNGSTWEGWGFGDGTLGAFDPQAPEHVYMGTAFNLHRHDTGGAKDALNPASGWQLNIFQPAVGDSAQFMAPFAIDPVSPATVFAASATGLYRSDNRGDTWGARINTDPLDGQPTTIAVSPVNHNYVWVGTSVGWVYMFDFQASLINQRGASLPGRYLSKIVPSPSNADTLYVVDSGYDANTPTTPGKVFKSINQGLDFTDISGNLPDVPVSALAVDPTNEQHMWAGTDIGVFFTSNGGIIWTSLRGNMPVVPVMDLKYNPTTRFLTAATYGRGAWRINPDRPAFHTRAFLPVMKTPAQVFPVLQNADFEQGHTAWTETSPNFAGSLIVQQGAGGAPGAQSGSWLAWLGGVDNETGDLSQQVTIPAGPGPIYLHYYYEISSVETNCNQGAPSDAYSLFINDTFADGFVVCNAYNTGAAWIPSSFAPDLRAYAGQTVTLHIKVVTDGALTSSVYFDTFSFSSSPTVLQSTGSPLHAPPIGSGGKINRN